MDAVLMLVLAAGESIEEAMSLSEQWMPVLNASGRKELADLAAA